LGSTAALTNQSGAVVERQQYDAFGYGNGSSLTRYGFTGRDDGLLTSSGSVVAVGDITRHEGQFKVYNFEVEQAHDYFVSGLNVLAHNTCSADGDAVIQETLNHRGRNPNLTSANTLDANDALAAGEKFLGSNYRQMGPNDSGVFRSQDGLRGFRIDPTSIQGLHTPHVPHTHFETFTPGNVRLTNNHVPIKNF
jgi:hypothetical protein